ncbi:acetaldehyde dehydrogenase/alcohol dehydrogenase [Bacillus sp. SLBN-46]|uniref:bifunctional acetaldehyde-CoA/alcohol dehydrogenase n=1 Tax=Bacillus sp. SLBN-46 TaxID=3042283 RepID=UPI002855AFE6|nr:bifunctional acetaldehyde-CoA/alcohol dehydrogenase [Bacillus sp. SLBN-46]MDR6124126.1 acetaldehyde dehydrogenase/alcohol dehydrogenase [Bacillus sp. SLBN-46]
MAVEEKALEQKQIGVMIERLAQKGEQALNVFRTLNQEKVDQIVKSMALTALENQDKLAKMAVDETNRGLFEDKISKNMFATEMIYNSIRNLKTVGIISENEHEGTYELAEPVGVIAALVPITNPTSTVIYKSLISLKTRNPIIFSFHHLSQKSGIVTAQLLREAAIKAGAPENCIQWLDEPSREAIHSLMRHPKVSLILATGGSSMVKEAYSSGKPAIGVGPGNVPCYFEKTANVKSSVQDLLLSKTYDNGMICASEQALIIDKEIYSEVITEMMANKCYFLNETEKQQLEHLAIKKDTSSLNPMVVGLPAFKIAEMAGIEVPKDTKVLVVELDGVGPNTPLSCEKLSPILACYKANNVEEAFDLAEQTLEYGGLGHTASIHTSDDRIIEQFAMRMRAGRILVNTPSAQGATGNVYNDFLPTLTLGCGTYGGNSVSVNVGATHLLNIKKVAKRNINAQVLRTPPQIYYKKNSIQTLEFIPDISNAFIVTSPSSIRNGYVDKVIHFLKKRADFKHVDIFSEVEPDPSIETVQKGAECMRHSQPDVIIALGGGSVLDAAKAMWLFYEHPATDFDALKQKFLNPRKRVVTYPKLRGKAKLIAIPTTSGTGSEVTSFAVITDNKSNIKYPLSDPELLPDIAIIDPQFTMTVPKHITADTGMDVLTHALEAYVSVCANDFTDGQIIKAIQLVFEYLPRAYHDSTDALAREKMHYASTMAGLAFNNAFLGINHSLAHALGAEFHIAHGRANAIFLPHVIRFNSKKPTKFTPFAGYEHFIADQRYAELAKFLGLQARTTEEGIVSLIEAIITLAKGLDMPLSIEECGINYSEFENKVDLLALHAFNDPDTNVNPRRPLTRELAEILRQAYKGI